MEVKEEVSAESKELRTWLDIDEASKLKAWGLRTGGRAKGKSGLERRGLRDGEGAGWMGVRGMNGPGRWG